MLAKRLSQLRELRAPGVSGLTSHVRDLVLIASSSRGGSSMLAELLRHSSDVIHLQGEVNPMLRLAGLSFPVSCNSDQLTAAHLKCLSPAQREDLETDIAQDSGSTTDTVDDFQFILAAAWRLLIQWPSLDFDIPDLLEIASRTLHRVRLNFGWEPGRIADPNTFLLTLLEDLRMLGADVDPYFYDLPGRSVGEFGRARATDGPPSELIVEETPFIVPRAWRRAGAADFETKPLLIKSPSNAYRLDFFNALFCNARIRVLHLVRNPAGAINGLFDGWRYHGFHSHHLPEPLSIEGYGTHRPGDRMWWKFDLPPDWYRVTGLPLLNVCAFQWRSSHQAILTHAAGLGSDYLRVRFEDLCRDPATRTAALARIAAWLDIPLQGALARVAADGIPPVVATVPPTAGRWRQRREAILGAIDRDVATIADEFGYGTDGDWI